MELEKSFFFRGLPDFVHPPIPVVPNPYGPLAVLEGTWTGTGFNQIWRPNNTPGQDRFLELNVTQETLQFELITGNIPNRGLLQPDMNMHGLTYLQQIKDSNLGAGIHVEPGIWAVVPPTTNPAEVSTVVRMASIPHGTAFVAQGVASSIDGAPTIPEVSITPFSIGNPGAQIQFPESNLGTPTNFRSPPNQLIGISQGMVDNPNSVLTRSLAALGGHKVTHTTVLTVSTEAQAPLVGGGISNTAFLEGAPQPNARGALVRSTFWIETVSPFLTSPGFIQLQYSQMVFLNFNGLTWPHVSVATLRKQITPPHPLIPAPLGGPV